MWRRSLRTPAWMGRVSQRLILIRSKMQIPGASSSIVQWLVRESGLSAWKTHATSQESDMLNTSSPLACLEYMVQHLEHTSLWNADLDLAPSPLALKLKTGGLGRSLVLIYAPKPHLSPLLSPDESRRSDTHTCWPHGTHSANCICKHPCRRHHKAHPVRQTNTHTRTQPTHL